MQTLNKVEFQGNNDLLHAAEYRRGAAHAGGFGGGWRWIVGGLLGFCLLGAGCRSFSWDWPPWGGLPIPGDEPGPEFPESIQWIYGSDISAWPVTIELRSAVVHHKSGVGSGYPNGLKGEQIPLGARISTLVDAYDAMRSDRPYRQGMPREAAIEEIRHHCGPQFNPTVVEVFMRRADDIETMGNWINS